MLGTRVHVDGHRGLTGQNRLLLLLDSLLRLLLNVRRHLGHLLDLSRRLDMMDSRVRCNLLYGDRLLDRRRHRLLNRLLHRLLDRLMLNRLLDRLLNGLLDRRLNRLLDRLLHRLLHRLLNRLRG